MAADAYVIAAAGHLESAANELKMEADQIRAEFKAYDRDITHTITSKEAEMRTHSVLLTATNDDVQRAHLADKVKQLKSEIDQHKSELEQRRKAVDAAANSKMNDMGQLQSKANELRNKAGSLK